MTAFRYDHWLVLSGPNDCMTGAYSACSQIETVLNKDYRDFSSVIFVFRSKNIWARSWLQTREYFSIAAWLQKVTLSVLSIIAVLASSDNRECCVEQLLVWPRVSSAFSGCWRFCNWPPVKIAGTIRIAPAKITDWSELPQVHFSLFFAGRQ